MACIKVNRKAKENHTDNIQGTSPYSLMEGELLAMKLLFAAKAVNEVLPTEFPAGVLTLVGTFGSITPSVCIKVSMVSSNREDNYYGWLKNSVSGEYSDSQGGLK